MSKHKVYFISSFLLWIAFPILCIFNAKEKFIDISTLRPLGLMFFINLVISTVVHIVHDSREFETSKKNIYIKEGNVIYLTKII